MNSYSVRIELPEGELEELMKQINEAQATIRDCYYKLDRLGVVTFVKKEEAASGD